MCEKAQTENAIHVLMDGICVIPNAEHRKNNVTVEEVCTMCQFRLEFPVEEEEDLDEHAHRVNSVCLLMPLESSPWGVSARVPIMICVEFVNTSFVLHGTMTLFPNLGNYFWRN